MHPSTCEAVCKDASVIMGGLWKIDKFVRGLPTPYKVVTTTGSITSNLPHRFPINEFNLFIYYKHHLSF